MDEKMVEIQIELDSEILYKIQYIAKKNKISVDELIEKLIEEYENGS